VIQKIDLIDGKKNKCVKILSISWKRW